MIYSCPCDSMLSFPWVNYDANIAERFSLLEWDAGDELSDMCMEATRDIDI